MNELPENCKKAWNKSSKKKDNSKNRGNKKPRESNKGIKVACKKLGRL